MTPNRPYLIRAFYEWIVDNDMTPHLMVNAEWAEVAVPEQHIHEGRITLNIKPSAVEGLLLGNEMIEFNARFSGVPRVVRVPVPAVLVIYALETGQGMAFHGQEGDDEPPPPPPDKKPMLKVVK